MPRRLGLAWKLALAYLAVFVVTLTAIMLALDRATTESFQDYVSHTQMMSDMMGNVSQDMASMMGPSEQEFLDRVRWSLALAGGVGALAAGLTAFLTGRYITRRLRAMADGAGAIAAGDFSRKVEQSSGDELGELAEAFNRMAGSLAGQEEARRRLVADIAHELRTPLAVLQAEIEALQDGVAETTPDRLDSLHQQTELLARLVDDLRTLSLADSGQLHLQLGRHDLHEIARRALAAVAAQARQKGVDLKLARQDRPAPVMVDGDRIDQVLRNLLSNALRHTEAGGRIAVTTRADKGRALVEVADTGTGIAAEDLPHVFDRFYRADPSRSRATGGSGLGLAIARQLIRALGGDISVRSPSGEGTIFTFWLPLSTVAPTQHEKARPADRVRA
jgi:two-component system sensor histidine kinase BaeS